MNANFASFLYLVSGILFILALRGLSHPTTSRQGNIYGMIGMGIAIVTTLATSQMIHVRGTQDYLVTREFAGMASRDQKRALLDGLFAVSASDASIVTVEDNEIRRIASEIGLEHSDVVEIRQRYRDRLAVLKREEG